MQYYWKVNALYLLIINTVSMLKINAEKLGLRFFLVIFVLFIARTDGLTSMETYSTLLTLPSKIATYRKHATYNIILTKKNNRWARPDFWSYFSHPPHVIEKKIGLWEDLIRHFSLNHQVNNPAVRKQLKWIVNHPDYIKTLTKQSQPYLFHVYDELKKRNLPGELALIPMIESEYDPFSSSNKGAAGIWQIMPETARDLGLIRNHWVDGRKNFKPSTNAALNYLDYLHQFFHGNWMLAVAAYNSGEGTVKKAMRRSHRSLFWSLPLPRETKQYIPRLLALAEIIQNPMRYHIKLPILPQEPYLQEVEVKDHINLKKAAELAKIPSRDLYKLNPGFKDWSEKPSHSYKLLIPTKAVSTFKKNLAELSKIAK